MTAEQLKRFSNECLLMRKALQDGQMMPESDYQILRSGVLLLLAELEESKAQSSSSRNDQIRSLF